DYYPDVKEVNPMLEKYVDCLHFILSIGNDLRYSDVKINELPRVSKINHLFNYTFCTIGELSNSRDKCSYTDVFNLLIILGNSLGFTWEQIEQAYYDKNAINHERQKTGY